MRGGRYRIHAESGARPEEGPNVATDDDGGGVMGVVTLGGEGRGEERGERISPFNFLASLNAASTPSWICLTLRPPSFPA